MVESELENVAIVEAADINGDGRTDIVLVAERQSGEHEVNWLENAGDGSFVLHETIHHAFGIQGIKPSDMDRDGDLDLVVSTQKRTEWYRNTDGKGTFVLGGSVSLPVGELQTDVAVGDVDGDGYGDFVFITSLSPYWYKNVSGTGDFGPAQLIGTTPWADAQSVEVADMNGDANLDVIVTYRGLEGESLPSAVVWFSNLGERAGFDGTARVAVTPSFNNDTQVALGDVDGDGDLDVSVIGEGRLAWSLNVDGNGTFGSEVTTLSVFTDRSVESSLMTADLNADGKADLIAVAVREFRGDREVLYFDGQGTDPMVIAIGARDIAIADFDSDGDLDVLTSDMELLKSTVTPAPDGIGDLNNDFVVTMEDFLILSANYGRNDGNVLPSHGDIDGDGEVGFADFLILSQNFGK